MARDDMPSWPPSPVWALTMMPYASVTYANVYYRFFGSFEGRLDRALRGRPANDEPPAAAAQGDPAVGEEQVPDLGTALWRLGNAAMNLLDGDDIQADEPDVGIELGLELVIDENAEQLRDEAPVAGVDIQQEDQVGQGRQEAPPGPRQEDPVEDHAAPQEPLEQQPAENQQMQNDNDNEQADDNRGATTLSELINAMVTQLLFPVVAAGVGEVLSLTLPRSWFTKDPYRRQGLLQERWGRSLVGGCLFVVFRDAFTLYTKYRRVEVKKHRKIKNVQRKRDKGGGKTVRS